MNWYDSLDCMEEHPAYLEKLMLDEYGDDAACEERKVKHKKQRNCAWIRNRSHKKRVVRLFLSMNPAMDYSTAKGVKNIEGSCIYMNDSHHDLDTHHFIDRTRVYEINPYTRVYLNYRGSLRILHGAIFRIHTSFAVSTSKKYTIKQMNRRLRHGDFGESMPSYSFCKKQFCPKVDEIW